MQVETLTTASQFFSTLWPEPPQEGGRLGVGTCYGQEWFELTPGGIASASQHAGKVGTDVYFAVCAHDRTEGSRNNASATFAPALWVDLDFEKNPGDGYPTITQAQTAMQALQLPPSIAVNSGRGLHLYWPLDEPMPAKDASNLCWRWQEYVRRSLPVTCRLDSTADPARLLRVPGTVHSKCGRMVEVVHRSDKRYSPDEFANLLDEMGIAEREQSPASGELHDPLLPLPIDPNDTRILDAIERSQPDHVGTGHEAIFTFARELKAIPALAGLHASTLKPYAVRWYERAANVLEGVTPERVYRDFAGGWPLVKFPAGGLQAAMKRATEMPDPRAVLLACSLGFRTERLTRTLALCYELGRMSNSFPLSSHLLAGWLDCKQPTAYNYLGTLAGLGLILRTKKGRSGTLGMALANEYRLTELALLASLPSSLPTDISGVSQTLGITDGSVIPLSP